MIQFRTPGELETLIKKRLLTNRWEILHVILKQKNRSWMLRRLNNPVEMKIEMVRGLAKELNMQPYELLRDYGCGADAMTAGDALQMRAEWKAAHAEEYKRTEQALESDAE